MNKYIFILVTFLAILFSSCSKSPLSKMQSIAKEAQEKGKNWSEDEWKEKCKVFQTAAEEFVKSNPKNEDLEAGDKAAVTFLEAASKSSLSSIGDIIGTMLNGIDNVKNNLKTNMQKGMEEANDAMQQGMDEVNEAMQQGMDDVNEAMQQGMDEINKSMQ